MGRVPKRKLKEDETAEDKASTAKAIKGRGRPKKTLDDRETKDNKKTTTKESTKGRGRPPTKIATGEEANENGEVQMTDAVKGGTKRKREETEEVNAKAKRGRGRPPAKAAKAIVAFKAVRERPDDAPGVVLTLGQGDTGQLGLGEDILDRSKPALVKSVDGVVAISAGGMHSLCLTKTGKVYSFGCNDDGALGRETKDDDECFTPACVDIPGQVVQISAGDSHSVALTEDGQAYYWGTFRDSSGPFGLTPDGKAQSLPVALATRLKVRKIASGSDHIALLTREGQIYTVGTAEQGQLGRVGERFVRRGGRRGPSLLLTPDVVHAKNKRVVFEDVWAGSYNTYALTSDGNVLVCGLNNYCQLGIPLGEANMFFTMVKSGTLTSLSKEAGLVKIVPGQHHVVILDGKGRVFVMGRKEYGRLGLGQEDAANQLAESGTPTAIRLLIDVTDVAAGTAVSFSVNTSGQVMSWGMGTNGQLGHEDDDDAWIPAKMLGKNLEGRKVLQVSGGGQHTVLLGTSV